MSNHISSGKSKIIEAATFQFFSVKEVAIILDTSAKTVHGWINEGKLPRRVQKLHPKLCAMESGLDLLLRSTQA